MDSTDKQPDRQFTVNEVVAALHDEVQRLGLLYDGDLGYGYLAWRRRLDDLMDDQRPERDEAHRILLAVYENAAEVFRFE